MGGSVTRRIAYLAVGVSALVLLLSLFGGTDNLAQERSGLAPGRWLVPSPQAGTISEALAQAQPGDQVIVDFSYDAGRVEAVGATRAMPQGTPELFPLEIDQAGLEILCTVLPDRVEGTRARVVAPRTQAAFVVSADRARIEGCAVEGAGVGVVALQASELALVDNVFSDLQQGIHLIETHDSLLADNRISGVVGHGIHLERSDRNRIEANHVERSGAGLYASDASENRIGGGAYERNVSAGLFVRGGRDTVIEDLSSVDNGQEGVLLVDTTNARLIDSIFERNGGSGIALVGTVDTLIKDNRLADNAASPIALSEGESVRFEVPLLGQRAAEEESDDEVVRIHEDKEAIQAAVDALGDRIERVDRDLVRTIGDIDPTRVQTAPARFLSDALNRVRFIHDAVIPLSINPLLRDGGDAINALRGRELGPAAEDLREELVALRDRFNAFDEHLDVLGPILDDDVREDSVDNFDDAVDWLEHGLSVEGAARTAAFGAARTKLEVALVQSGRAELVVEQMREQLRAIEDKLPRLIPSDFTFMGEEVATLIAHTIPRQQQSALERALLARLNEHPFVTRKLRALDQSALASGDLDAQPQLLSFPRGTVLWGNDMDGAFATQWRGHHRQLFADLVQLDCLRGRPADSLQARRCEIFSSALGLIVPAEETDVASDALSAVRPALSTPPRLVASPNPVALRGEVVRLTLIGFPFERVRFEVYDLGGRRVFQSDWELEGAVMWNLLDSRGQRVANGVYLATAMAQQDGKTVRSKVVKLMVLR